MEREFITKLMVAVSNCSLYSKDHESFDELARKAHDELLTFLEDRCEVMVLDGELVVNNKPLRDAGLHKNSLMKRIKRKGISRIDFKRGVSLAEMKQLIVDFSNNDKGLRNFPHIKAGSVDLKNGDGTGDENLVAFSTSEELAQIREVFDKASATKKLKIHALNNVVSRFVSSFHKEANVLHFMIPVKSHSEHTYIHAMNVGVLTMFQATYLGFDDNITYDMGIAGMLHDVGKQFISLDVLDKAGKLDDNEYSEMKTHPLLGAKHLARNDSIPRLAAIAAYEHHMQYDGSGYPGPYADGQRQHICSQVVAIADFFDALRSRRPYRESWNVHKIFDLMKKNSGTSFNPVLLDHFISAMEVSIAN